jgi:hypothetical protein
VMMNAKPLIGAYPISAPELTSVILDYFFP